MRQRLQKIMAGAGIASRRKAEELIREGRVSVNGRVVKELGTQADPEEDHIKVNGKLIRAEPLEYWAVHKPQGVLSAAADPQRRPLVTELVKSRRRLYPVGRLDFSSEGLIILTNDGELTRRVTQAGMVDKVYRVKVRGQPAEEQISRLREGIILEGQRMEKGKIVPLKLGHNSWYEVVLRQGKNQQIRRMFERIGHPVMRLRRTAIGAVRLARLPKGAARKLTPGEVQALKGKS